MTQAQFVGDKRESEDYKVIFKCIHDGTGTAVEPYVLNQAIIPELREKEPEADDETLGMAFAYAGEVIKNGLGGIEANSVLATEFFQKAMACGIVDPALAVAFKYDENLASRPFPQISSQTWDANPIIL